MYLRSETNLFEAGQIAEGACLRFVDDRHSAVASIGDADIQSAGETPGHCRAAVAAMPAFASLRMNPQRPTSLCLLSPVPQSTPPWLFAANLVGAQSRFSRQRLDIDGFEAAQAEARSRRPDHLTHDARASTAHRDVRSNRW